MSLPYTWSEEQSGLQTGNIPVSLFQIILRMFRIIMNTITMNGAGKLLPVFLPICADWWMPLLVYESFYRNLPVSKYNQTEQTYGPNELHDVAYYNRMKFAKLMSSTILIVRMISSGLPRIIMENWGFPA